MLAWIASSPRGISRALEVFVELALEVFVELEFSYMQ